ncbi:phage portal protein [Streptomyces sp. NPDC005525]|uniref:phage portal protein n=1 Tax=Streptomyces sp. NPDC005525 TaxID=3364720 RepID=UPI0036C62885
MGFKALFERRSAVANALPNTGTVTFSGGADEPYRTYAGASVSQTTALQVSAVWSCVSLISDSIASLPVDTYRTTGNRRRPVTGPAWLDRPNPFMLWHDFTTRVLVSMLLDGNAFLHVLKAPDGAVVGLVPIDPARVSIGLTEDGTAPVYRVDGEPYGPRDILHIPGAFTRPGELRGLSPIEYARQAIGVAKATEEHGARFFSQGASVSGIIQAPGEVDKEKALMLKGMFSTAHSGLKNSHTVGILTGGATWQTVSVTPEQAQFLETRKFQKTEIANFFRVPPYMLDPTVTSSWGAGIEEQNRWFVDQTLGPWLIRLERYLSTLLPAGQYLKFNTDARLRSNTADRYNAYSVAVSNGFMSRDEVRALEDLEPLPNGQGSTFTQPLNLGPVGSAPPVPDLSKGAPNVP